MEKNANCRICRRSGEKLFLKGEKCNTPKCPFAKRSYAPGQAGPKARMRRGSDYSIQLTEKQKARAIYGVSEKQMVAYYNEARKNRSATGSILMQLLEQRLDNAVFRAGGAPSRDSARQLVVHGNVKLNGGQVKSAGCQVSKGDKIETKTEIGKKDLPVWLKRINNNEFEIIDTPIKEEVSLIDEQLIIEFYSR